MTASAYEPAAKSVWRHLRADALAAKDERREGRVCKHAVQQRRCQLLRAQRRRARVKLRLRLRHQPACSRAAQPRPAQRCPRRAHSAEVRTSQQSSGAAELKLAREFPTKAVPVHLSLQGLQLAHEAGGALLPLHSARAALAGTANWGNVG